MPYDELVTAGRGGTLPDEVEITKQGAQFRVKTVIEYVDDPFDGEGVEADEWIGDYKQIEVTVYEIGRAARLAHLSSIVASKAAETGEGTGILRIYVNQKDATPVAGAIVEITHATSGWSIERMTSADGKPLAVIGVPADPEPNYIIKASKAGWYAAAEKTAAVLEQETTEVYLEINPPGKMNILVVDDKESPMTSFPLQLSEISLGYAQPFVTGADGRVLAEDLRSGRYYAEETSADYRLVKTQKGDPCVDTTQPILINDGDNLPVKLIVKKGGGAGGGECTDESKSITLDTQADWQAGTNNNTDLVSSPGDVKIADSGEVEFLADQAAGDPDKVTATVNSNDKMKAVDRDLGTAWVAALRANPIPERSQNWNIDLGASREITKMRFNAKYVASGGANSIAGVCYVSNDGVNFSNFDASAHPITPGGAAWYDCSGSGNYRYLRFTMGNSGGMPGNVDVSVYELEAYGLGGLATHISAATQIDGTSSFKTWDSFTVNETTGLPGGTIAYSFRTSNDSTSWDDWSSPVNYAGTPISLNSLSARRYLQARSVLTSTQSGTTPALHSYTIGFTVTNCSGGTVCPVNGEMRTLTSKADWQVGTSQNLVLSDPVEGDDGHLALATESSKIDLKAIYDSDPNRVTASLFSSTRANLIDGNLDTGWGGISAPAFYWQIDLGEAETITKIRAYKALAVTGFEVHSSDDGVNWTARTNRFGPEFNWTEITTFLPSGSSFSGRYIRLVKVGGFNPGEGGTTNEFELYRGPNMGIHISGQTQLDGGDNFDSWRKFTPTESDGMIGGVQTVITYSFRTSADGTTWSEDDWTAPAAYAGSPIALDAMPGLGLGRYLQVKSTLSTDNPSVTPVLSEYTLELLVRSCATGGSCVGGYREVVLTADSISSASVLPETAPLAIDGVSSNYWGKFTLAGSTLIFKRSMIPTKISLTNFSDKVTILSSTDGIAYRDVVTFDSASTTTVEKIIDGVYGSFWMVRMGDNMAEGDDGIERWLGEIKFYETCT